LNSNSHRLDQSEPLAPDISAGKRVVIVGGGASGTLMALHLVRKSLEIEVILVEKANRPGRGLAYGTTCAEHVVNVVPGRLSAFEDDPTHFVRWLHRIVRLSASESFAFVRRQLVGDYFAEVLDAARPNVTVVHDEVTALTETEVGVEVALKSSPLLLADVAILATGHDWIRRTPQPSAIPPDAAVTILGSGLSMVDRWLSLRSDGHRGPITAASRRGLIPHRHAPCARLEFDPSTLPLARPVSDVLRWLRKLAASQQDWRSAVDAIRPHVSEIWQNWTLGQRARFLRHARPYWDIHRHRLAPAVHARLTAELRTGILRVQRSRKSVDATQVFDCRGLRPAWNEIGETLIGHLVRWGNARPDALGIGLDVTDRCELIAANGAVSPTLYAIGPLTRGRFWEIEAVPDIRAQCESLAQLLASRLVTTDAVAR
jgi:uncharacterized NAD(P)/FAD-binding protein YdhS